MWGGGVSHLSEGTTFYCISRMCSAVISVSVADLHPSFVALM